MTVFMRRKSAWGFPVMVFMSLIMLMSSADPGDTVGQHGLNHPAVAIGVPELECECKDSFSFEANTIEASACREGGEVYWIFPVRGLVVGFVYEIRFEWFVLGTQNTRHWHNIFSSSTSSYTVRQPLSQIKARAWWDAYISKQDPFEFEVTVLDMHPGLTNEDALIGARRMNSAVNRARLKCAKSMRMASVAEEVAKPDKSINESVNKWTDMDERMNRNKKIALSTLTEVDIRFKWFTAIISGIEFQDMMEDSASTSGNGVVNELNKDEYHLKEIQKILRDGDIVLDLGSNIGLTAILIAKMNPGVKVIGVEPSPVNWVAAQRNIRKMGVHDRVTVLPAALCNSTVQTVKLFQDRGNAGQCTTHYGEVTRPDFKITKSWSGEGAHKEEPYVLDISCITVQEIVDRYGITETVFVKLDCEGCEYFVVPSLSPGIYSMMMNGYVMGETHARFIPLFFPDVSHESVEKTHKLFYNGGSIVERVRPSDNNRPYFLSDNDRALGVEAL